jgi:N-acyl homoserine lactone hydrolase
MKTRTMTALWAHLAMVALLAACSAEIAPSGNVEQADPDDALKLYVFNCGDIEFPSIEAFGVGDDETAVRRLVVPCYIIDHPQGTLLWDGGLPFAMAEPAGWQTNPDSGVRARLQKTLKDQLAELDLGFDLSTIDYAVFSHIHYDHVGAANELTAATWLVQRGDHEAVMAGGGGVPAVVPELFAQIRNRPTQVLDGDFDVFGDGRVQLITAPGHTPGHQVLYLELDDFGPLVLSGDLYHFRLSREQRRVPVFNVNKEQTLAAMDKVEALVNSTQASFWIEHDAQLFDTLDLAPLFYR